MVLQGGHCSRLVRCQPSSASVGVRHSAYAAVNTLPDRQNAAASATLVTLGERCQRLVSSTAAPVSANAKSACALRAHTAGGGEGSGGGGGGGGGGGRATRRRLQQQRAGGSVHR
jgi:hypothetical protein